MPYKDIRKARKASRLRMRGIRINKKVEQKGVTNGSLESGVNMLYPNVKSNSYSVLLPPKMPLTAEQKNKYEKWGINI